MSDWPLFPVPGCLGTSGHLVDRERFVGGTLMANDAQFDQQEEVREANTCIAFGASLGAVGSGTALLVGATCPLCVVLSPALIGYGVWKRIWSSRKRNKASNARPHDQVQLDQDD